MKTANIIVKVDPKIKKKVQRLAADAGLTVSDLINSSLYRYAEADRVAIVAEPRVRDEVMERWERDRRDMNRYPERYSAVSVEELIADMNKTRKRSRVKTR